MPLPIDPGKVPAIDLARKLWALAQDRSNAHEARLALERLAAVMDRHGLSLADVLNLEERLILARQGSMGFSGKVRVSFHEQQEPQVDLI